MVEGREFVAHVQELIAVKLGVLSFTKNVAKTAIHLQIDNTCALSYLLKMGGTHNMQMLKLSKEIWEYLFHKQITITAEYLPSKLNVEADWESRNINNSSEWHLLKSVFNKITVCLGMPDIDLFASRLCHQLPKYMAWKPDPNSLATDAMQHLWRNLLGFAFPPFSLISRVARKVRIEKVPELILVTPAWQIQLMQMSCQSPLLLPQKKNLLKNPKGEVI